MTKLRRIRRIKENKNVVKVREIVEQENSIMTKKSNIIEFYIKTNDTEEIKAKVLIDSESELNFIHPDFAKAFGIKLQKIEKPFKVAGLGQGTLTVKKETEKCILRLRNHLEIIQLYALRIPDVDIILGVPWIDKHCPLNYHDAKKISFGSSYCPRHCNNGEKEIIRKEPKNLTQIINWKKLKNL